MEYRLVEDTNKEQFLGFIDYLIDQGWELQGGISITLTESNQRLYAQAMKKTK